MKHFCKSKTINLNAALSILSLAALPFFVAHEAEIKELVHPSVYLLLAFLHSALNIYLRFVTNSALSFSTTNQPTESEDHAQ